MRKHVAWVVIAVVALGSVATVAAQERSSDSYSQYESVVRPLQKQLFDKRYELEELYRNGTPNDAQVQSLINEMGQLQAQLMAENTRMRSQDPDGYGYGSHWRGGEGYAHHGGGWGRGGHRGGGRGGRGGWCW